MIFTLNVNKHRTNFCINKQDKYDNKYDTVI